MASYANFINAEVQSHYANETYVNSLDKYSSLRLKFLPYLFISFWALSSPPFFSRIDSLRGGSLRPVV